MNELKPVASDAIEKALMQGDLSKLNEQQKLSYYKSVCETMGLNPLTKPFEYMRLNEKEVLYGGKNCAEQLRAIHKISIYKLEKDRDEDTYTVTAYARMPDGREDSSIGAVVIANLKGEALANAKMKCETKAKRRVTLSIVGLGMLDETEVASIPDAQRLKTLGEQNDSEQRFIKRGDSTARECAGSDLSSKQAGAEVDSSKGFGVIEPSGRTGNSIAAQAHPFADYTFAGGRYAGQTFCQTLEKEKVDGHEWSRTQLGHKKKGAKINEQVETYLTYAEECGAHLD